jgi:hypothetical protein
MSLSNLCVGSKTGCTFEGSWESGRNGGLSAKKKTVPSKKTEGVRGHNILPSSMTEATAETAMKAAAVKSSKRSTSKSTMEFPCKTATAMKSM